MECLELVDKIRETNMMNSPAFFLLIGLIFLAGILFEMCRISESTRKAQEDSRRV